MSFRSGRGVIRGIGLVGLILGVATAGLLPGAQAAEECGRLASVQNQVETRTAATDTWEPSTLNQMLAERDRVRTGEASRAAILYADQTLHRINEKSEVEVLPPQAGNPGVLRVISGQHYFSSRQPKDYGRIETPTVTAAIRGTEFAVDVAEDGATTITMIEGVVDASNEHGELQITAGEAAYVEPGKPPVKQIVVRPRDAVTWSLYYPRVLGGADAERLGAMGDPGRKLVRAAELLSAGQVDQAQTLIAEAGESAAGDPVALALESVIDVAADRREEAMTLAKRAIEADGDSAAAALAMSFAAQAAFDIPQAKKMAEKAARLDPDSAEAQARVAEMRMAEADIKGAREAAEKAVRRDPDSARALAVLGFVQLAELHSVEALATFERAVATDPGFPLARLGLGIARIRRGDLGKGREEMQTAVILDPDNSLYRSYLSKAYFEEKREGAASKELEIAKQLDPSDPTPHLYDALLKQAYNRPVEALHDLQKSIELNDRRAVYRSRLLLDEDLAVRSADMANIYNDLGFDQLGMVTARQSADMDQSNYSAHLFLAGTYRNLPGFAPAFLSETLQARIYQPVSVNAVRPDVVNETASFNEYTSLLDRPRLRGFAGARFGSTESVDVPDDSGVCVDPDGNFGPCADIVPISDSTAGGGDAVLTLNRDRFAGALSYETFDSDGFRINNDIDNDAVRGFFVFAPSYRDQLQLNFIDGSRRTGDQPLPEFPLAYSLERIETELTNVALGYHRIISPAADLAISAIYSDTKQVAGLNIGDLVNQSSTAELEGSQIEAQYVLRQRAVHWTAGLGHFDGEQTATAENLLGTVQEKGDDTFSNAYVYAKLQNLGPVEITAGLAYEDVLAPIGLLPPPDSFLGIGDVEYEDSQVSPKFGLSARATNTTVVRATAFSRLSPAIGRLQTLEPTQVAGFNQFYDDPGGTSSFNYGIGLDQQFTTSFFAGFSVLRRDLEIAEPICANPGVFGCAGQPAADVVQRVSDDWLGNIYLNGTVARRVALSLEYAYEEREFDFTRISSNSLLEDYVKTERLRPQVRYYMPMGFYTTVAATNYKQEVHQFDDPTSPARTTVEADFWLGDVQVGFRLPDRWGSVDLSVLNVTNKQFEFYQSSLEENVIPARTVLLTLSFTSP